MTTPQAIQTLIDEQLARRQQLVQDLKLLGADIADALVAGKSTTNLQKKQDSLRASMMTIPSTVKRLQERLAQAEADQLLNEIRQLHAEEPALLADYEKLSSELADLQNQVRALMNQASHARELLQDNQRRQATRKGQLIKMVDDLHSMADVDALLEQDHEQAKSQ